MFQGKTLLGYKYQICGSFLGKVGDILVLFVLEAGFETHSSQRWPWPPNLPSSSPLSTMIVGSLCPEFLLCKAGMLP